MKKFIVSLVLAFCSFSYAADYRVTAESLNIRSCPSTDCEVISTLKQGTVVQGNVSDGWLKTSINNTVGYASVRYLEQKPTATTSSTTYSDESNASVTIFIMILLFIAFVFFCIIYRLFFKYKCPKCKKLRALKRIKETCVNKEATHVVKRFETRNKKGEVIRTTEKPVPATKYYYEDLYTCKNCGYTNTGTRTVVKEN